MPAVAADVAAALLASHTEILRGIDIYESDGTTLWMEDAPFTEGRISVDQASDTRRTAEFTFLNEDDTLDHYAEGFWYDKIIKPWRGAVVNGEDLIWQQGEFMIDTISTQSFPGTVKVSCRDYTKKCKSSKFGRMTTFTSGQSVEALVRTLLVNAGITKMILPVTGERTGKEFTFEPDVSRWDAVHRVCQDYGFDHFFNASGYFVMQEFQDPSTAGSTFTFRTGGTDGSLISFGKRVSDARIYNHVVVTGGDSNIAPIVAEARNTEPSSPTNIASIGERTYRYNSTFITTMEQAQNVANKFLRLHALETYEINFQSIVIPTLEAGEVVTFIDPNPDPDSPTSYLLSNFTIPMTLDSMSADVKRVTIVG